MAFLTRTDAVRAPYGAATSVHLAEAALPPLTRQPTTQAFGVFLSHASEDAAVIVGVKALLQA